MKSKIKKSISLSNALLEELALFNNTGSVSGFIEIALGFYLAELKKQKRRQKDIEILNANAVRFSKEAIENLEFQAVI